MSTKPTAYPTVGGRSTDRRGTSSVAVAPSRAPVRRPAARRCTGASAGPALATATRCANLVTVAAAGGGIGASTVAALMTAELDRRNRRCVLVDADFDAGGIDVLLGLEGEPGVRFESVDAPLGSIDGHSLNHELPHWGHVGVLAFDSWNGAAPDPWQAGAVVRALCEANRVVIADVGRTPASVRIPDLVAGMSVLVCELSVLGLARARGWLDRSAGGAGKDVILVGVEPRGSAVRGAVSVAEAEDYLDRSVDVSLRYDRRLHGDMLAGLGIRTSTRHNRRAIGVLADHVEAMTLAGRDDD